MPQCAADATWNGTVTNGAGEVSLASGAWHGRYATPDAPDATDPEELLAAAHAGCFAMTVTHALSEAGYAPERVDAEATVTLAVGEAVTITGIDLVVAGVVPDAAAEEFRAVVEAAEGRCPVSKALAGTDVDVTASLL